MNMICTEPVICNIYIIIHYVQIYTASNPNPKYYAYSWLCI